MPSATKSGKDLRSLLATDRLDLLRLFISAAECGKVSGAAQTLGLSQPSASRLLRRLEAIVDARLLTRTQQGVTLTQTGEEFLIAARRLLDEWDRAVDATKADLESLSGHIRIAAPVAVGQSMLASVVARFVRIHPRITVDWEVNESQLAPDSGAYDLWFRIGNVNKEHLVVRPFGYTRRALISARALGVVDHPRDLQSHPAVRISTAVPRLVELQGSSGEKFMLRQRCSFTTDNLYAACEAVREGVGYAVLPFWSVQSDINRGILVQTCPTWTPPPLVLSLSYLPDGKRPKRVTALLEHLKNEFMRGDGSASHFFDSLEAGESVGRTSDHWFTDYKAARQRAGPNTGPANKMRTKAR